MSLQTQNISRQNCRVSKSSPRQNRSSQIIILIRTLSTTQHEQRVAGGWWLAAAGDVCDYHFVNDELMYGCIHGIDVKWIFCLIETYKILCGIIHHILSADKLRPSPTQIHFPAPAPALPATGQGGILCQYLQLFLLWDETYLISSPVHVSCAWIKKIFIERRV